MLRDKVTKRISEIKTDFNPAVFQQRKNNGYFQSDEIDGKFFSV